MIQLENASLCYRLAKQRIPSFKEYAIHWMKGALSYEELWALQDIDLTIGAGETVAILGRNGAGKSTLLKVISRVLKPTKGRARTDGFVAPILELGTGFDYELTGLENIMLNALMLGRSRLEIQEKIDSIVEFSGLGDFVRSPIRNYSSGMIGRLGFSIATAWIPDVLVLDEVLTVGDARFQPRCLARLSEFHEAGTTVLMVSHVASGLEGVCQRAVWLERGRLVADGSLAEVGAKYAEFSAGGTALGIAESGEVQAGAG